VAIMPRDPAPIPAALRQPESPAVPRLALRLSEAAESLGCCSKWLADLEDGPPRLTIGRKTLFPVELLAGWLRDHAMSKAKESGPAAGYGNTENAGGAK